MKILPVETTPEMFPAGAVQFAHQVIRNGGSLMIVAARSEHAMFGLAGQRNRVRFLDPKHGRASVADRTRIWLGSRRVPTVSTPPAPRWVLLHECCCGAGWRAYPFAAWIARPHLSWSCRYGHILAGMASPDLDDDLDTCG